MKILKTASGKKSVKMSKSEWQSIGKTAGWGKKTLDNDFDLETYLESLKPKGDSEHQDKIKKAVHTWALENGVPHELDAAYHLYSVIGGMDIDKEQFEIKVDGNNPKVNYAYLANLEVGHDKFLTLFNNNNVRFRE